MKKILICLALSAFILSAPVAAWQEQPTQEQSQGQKQSQEQKKSKKRTKQPRKSKQTKTSPKAQGATESARFGG
jgi:Ni/Co efflux regulator RcnB